MTKHLATALAAALLAAGTAAAAPSSPQVPFAGSAIPQFVQPLAIPEIVAGSTAVTLRMCEFKAKVLPTGTFQVGAQPLTSVWGYVAGAACPGTDAVRETYLGPILVNTRGTPTQLTFVNELGTTDTTGVLAYKYSTDQTLHWADPANWGMNGCMMEMTPAPGSACSQNYAGAIAAVPHLHGGEVPPELDGGPDAWVTSDGARRGAGFYSAPGAPANGLIYTYPNTQEASPIWFHDHTLGATRLNVYAGLAGGYLVTDPGAVVPNLPGLVPLIVQDRMFDTNGQLFFTAGTAGGVLWALNPEHPYWNPEFVGDAIAVNGKVWPYLDVAPKRVRFLLLNGSNARTYELSLTNQVTNAAGPAIWVIGNDGGYLDRPVKLDPAAKQKLVMMPGERYEVIVDFTGQPAGTKLVLKNTAKTPYPAGATPNGQLDKVIQFRVGACAKPCTDASYDPATGAPLRPAGREVVRLTDPVAGTMAVTPRLTRQVTLNEVMGMPMTAPNPIDGTMTAYPGGPLEILVNNTKWSGASARTYGDFTPVTRKDGMGMDVTTYYSEQPQEGDTEVWEIVNLTADAHPMHFHLVQFQVLNRQAFNTKSYGAAYAAAFPGVAGDPTCPAGAFCPGFGPPLDYYTGNPRALGGNPDVTPFLSARVAPPLPQESGWKDTVLVPPGQVTRLAIRWAPTSVPATAAPADLAFPFDPSGGPEKNGYVWHCHIVDHEDNEMMRPDLVQLNPVAPAPAARDFVRSIDY